MRKTNFMRSLKRRALPLLTSVAMAISMLSGTGVTAMAADPIGDAGTMHYGIDTVDSDIDVFATGFSPTATATEDVSAGMLNKK